MSKSKGARTPRKPAAKKQAQKGIATIQASVPEALQPSTTQPTLVNNSRGKLNLPESKAYKRNTLSFKNLPSSFRPNASHIKTDSDGDS